MVEHIEMIQTNKETITASGRFATALLDRRIIWGTELLSGDIGACVGQLVTNHLINPDDPARKIDFVSYAAQSFGIRVNYQVSYKNLLETVTDLCDTADVGVKSAFNPTTGHVTLSLYQGTQTQAVFSREYENLVSQTYIHNVLDARDTVLVAGNGDGEARTLLAILGNERREMFVDARDLQSRDFPDGSYEDALLFRGRNKLADHPVVQSLDAQINARGNLTYKTDFDLGSVVTVQARRWGLSLQTRVTEVMESYDESGVSIDCVFGRGVLTLSQRLKGAG